MSIPTSFIMTTDTSMAAVKAAAPDLNKAVSAFNTAADAAKNAAADAAAFVQANPKTAAAYAAAGVGIVVAAAPAIVVSPTLAVAGFAADGVVKGSIAAGVQSGIGNVAATSLFATLQSAGAGGVGAAAVSAGVSAVSGAASTLVAGAAWLKGLGNGGGNEKQ